MRSVSELADLVKERHGDAALDSLISGSQPKTTAELAAIPDDRWLAMATRCIFQAGFNWKVVEAKWEGFESAFDGFDPGRWVLSNDDDLASLISDTRIIRNPQKIRSVPENARFVVDVSREHGGFGRWVALDPIEKRNLLLETMGKRGNRLGSMTGQYFLRFMGADSYILSRDVTAALVREGIIDKQPSSKKAMQAVQDAFNEWMRKSDYGLTTISRLLARSIDG